MCQQSPRAVAMDGHKMTHRLYASDKKGMLVFRCTTAASQLSLHTYTPCLEQQMCVAYIYVRLKGHSTQCTHTSAKKTNTASTAMRKSLTSMLC